MTEKEKQFITEGASIEVFLYADDTDSCNETVKETIKMWPLKQSKYAAMRLADQKNNFALMVAIASGKDEKWAKRLVPICIKDAYNLCKEVNANGFFWNQNEAQLEQFKSVQNLDSETIQKLRDLTKYQKEVEKDEKVT